MKKPRKPTLKLVGTNPSAPPVNAFQPPPNLGTSGANCWKRIMNQYEILDAGGLELLSQLCLALDDLDSTSATIERDGLLVRGRNGLKENPLLRHQLGLRSFISRTIARLGLDVEPIRPTSGRPSVWEDD